MPSLSKDPRGKSPYWYARFRTAGGRQKYVSTKLTNYRAALEVALNLERAEKEAAKGQLTGARVRELLNDTLERINGRPVEQVTLRSWFTKWLAEKESDGSLSKNSEIAYAASIRLFLTHLGKRADEGLRGIRADDVQAFKTTRIAAGLTAKTIDRDLKVLRTIFKQARLHGHVDLDPTQLVPLLSKQNKRNVQAVTRETFTADELDALGEAAAGEWLTTLLLARYTGARLGDCVRMTWANIDLETEIISYTDAKTHKNYVVPLHPRLKGRLSDLPPEKNARTLLCPTLAGKPSGGKYGLSMEFRRIMARAGIDDRSVVTKAVKSGTGTVRHLARRSFHSIRHTYNSALANTGASQEVRRKLLGHSDDDMNDRYTHLDVTLFREAINRLQ